MMKPSLVCVPLTQPTAEEMRAILQERSHEFDLAEVRLDYLNESGLTPLFAEKKYPLLFTNRAPRDFGHWKGSEEERLDFLRKAIDLGAEWIDLERECVSTFEHGGTSKTIISYHNFEETPINLPAIAREIEEMDGDVVKVATMARSHQDNARMIETIRRIKKPVIGVTMGRHGHIVRILGPKLGAFLVFASLDTGRESAPGQIPVGELLQHFRFREINSETSVYGLVDLPSGGRWAKTVNLIFREAGINAVAIAMESEDLADVLNAYRGLPFSGFSLGPVHWKRAVGLADELEAEPRTVDTILWREGYWAGLDSGTGPFDVTHGHEDMASRLTAQVMLWTGIIITKEALLSLAAME